MDRRLTPARLVRVNGPLLEVEGLAGVAMSELVALGESGIPGEVVSIRGTTVTVQAYEYTGGLAAGDPVAARGHPLSARLGPDLLGGVFDGLLRPLSGAPTWLAPDGRPRETTGTLDVAAPRHRGRRRDAGRVLGTLPRRGGPEFRVLVPPGVDGRVDWLAAPGGYGARDRLAVVAGTPVSLTTVLAGAPAPSRA